MPVKHDNKLKYILHVLEECLEVAYHGSATETQERIDLAVHYCSELLKEESKQ